MAWWVNELWRRCAAIINPLHLLCLFFLVSNTSLRQPTCLYMRCKKNNWRWLGKYFIHASASPPPVFWPLENDAVWQKNTHIWINVLTVEPSRLVLVYLLFSGNPRPQLRTILAFFLTSIIIIAWKKTLGLHPRLVMSYPWTSKFKKICINALQQFESVKSQFQKWH